MSHSTRPILATAAPDVEDAVRAIVAERLPLFAGGWLLVLSIWTIAILLLPSPPVRILGATLAFQGSVLGLAILARRHARVRTHVHALVFGVALTLVVSTTTLFARAAIAAEFLAVTVQTLGLMTALLFPWGWRRQLVLVVAAAGSLIYAITGPATPLRPVEFAAAVTIGISVALAVAEGTARGFRTAHARRQGEQAALRALAASRDSYRDLTDNAHDVVWAADLEGRLTYINNAGARMFGAPPEDLLERNVDHFATDRATNPRFSEVRSRLIAGTTVPPIPVEWKSVQGPTWVEIAANVVRDPDGTVIGFRGIGRDVTARFRIEQNLRESEERFRIAFEQAAIGMVVVSPEGRTVQVNEALARMLGYERDDLLRVSWEDLTHPEDVELTRAAVERAIEGTASSYQVEKRYRHRLGHDIWGSLTGAVVRDVDGSILCLIAQVQDVTKRKEAEAALREREDELRLMARRQVALREEERKRLGFDLHDGVCQELVGIAILIASARQRGVSASASSTLGAAQDYLGRVGEHLRVLAREMRPLQLPDLGLGECLRILAAGMSTPTLRITVHFPSIVPRLDEEAEVAVYRVAQEAITNALRHAEAGTVTVTLGAEGNLLRLEIRDDGRGFDRTASRASALGLVAMEERALALGGTLRVESAPGTGTTVCLELPLADRSPRAINDDLD